MRKKKCVCLTLYEYTNIELKERGKKALKYFSKSQISFGSFGPPTPTSPTIQILQYSKQYNAYSFYFYPRTTHHSVLIPIILLKHQQQMINISCNTSQLSSSAVVP